MDRIVQWLQDRELNVEAAILLEAASPLAWIGAQAVYIAEPFLGVFGVESRSWAEVMEDPEQIQNLVSRLRNEV
jgi:hypothetical protein